MTKVQQTENNNNKQKFLSFLSDCFWNNIAAAALLKSLAPYRIGDNFNLTIAAICLRCFFHVCPRTRIAYG